VHYFQIVAEITSYVNIPRITGESEKQAFSWFQKNEKNVIFTLALILVSVLSFELGSLTVAKGAGGALVIEKPAVSLAQIKKDAGMAEEGRVAGAEATSDKQQGTSNKGDGSGIKTDAQTQCMFVGSKNSTKYHSPSCSYAKRIKPEMWYVSKIKKTPREGDIRQGAYSN
jgi:hypothetical protein